LVVTESLWNRICHYIETLGEIYYELLLVVFPSGFRKTAALRKVKACTGAPLTNVHLGLSRLILDLKESERALLVSSLLHTVIDSAESDFVLLDNSEPSSIYSCIKIRFVFPKIFHAIEVSLKIGTISYRRAAWSIQCRITPNSVSIPRGIPASFRLRAEAFPDPSVLRFDIDRSVR
jgi:hypothetical protein